MTDYTELVKALRYCADNNRPCNECPVEKECIDYGGWENIAAAFLVDAADAIEELLRINEQMKYKYKITCSKCSYFAEAKINSKGFLICPASGMDITERDFCSYFHKKEEKE